MKRISLLVATLGLASICTNGILSTPAHAQTSEVRVKIRLAGAAIGGVVPQGSSEYRARSATRRSFSVEVNRVNLPSGTALSATVNGVPVGRMVLNLGSAALQLETDRRQIVPVIKSGDIVHVATPSGALVAAGRF